MLVGRFLALSGRVGTTLGLERRGTSNVGYDGLDLIPGGKSLFPEFNANWKSLVPEKRNELNHVVVMIDENTAFTAEKDGDTSSSVASSTPTSPTSQA